MNPYIEQEEVWHDFHERACPLVAEMLTAQVRPHYIVKIDEHIYIHELPNAPRKLVGRSDVEVARLRENGGARGATGVLEAPSISLRSICFGVGGECRWRTWARAVIMPW